MSAWNGLTRWSLITLVFASILLTGIGDRVWRALPQPAPSWLGARVAVGRSDVVSPPIFFRDVGRQVGLTSAPRSTIERGYIVETMGGGGIALFDCDNDGRLDIALVNDSSIESYLAGGDGMVTLYHQDGPPGEMHFTDITKSAGLTTRGWGMAIAIGDFDNDGLPDLYVTGFGHNVLYRNLGGCRFEDVTAKAGVAVGGFSTGAAWADYDRDGYIDLFVARYVHTDLRHLPPLDPRSTGYRSVILQMPDEMEGYITGSPAPRRRYRRPSSRRHRGIVPMVLARRTKALGRKQ